MSFTPILATSMDEIVSWISITSIRERSSDHLTKQMFGWSSPNFDLTNTWMISSICLMKNGYTEVTSMEVSSTQNSQLLTKQSYSALIEINDTFQFIITAIDVKGTLGCTTSVLRLACISLESPSLPTNHWTLQYRPPHPPHHSGPLCPTHQRTWSDSVTKAVEGGTVQNVSSEQRWNFSICNLFLA